MIANKYDLKEFLSLVMKSEAWQRETLTKTCSPGEPVHFEAPFLQRLSSEQVWDTFVALIVDNPERTDLNRNAYRIRYLNDLRIRASKFSGKSPEAVAARTRTDEGNSFARRRGRAPSSEVEALLLLQKASLKAMDKVRSEKIAPRQAFYDWKSSHSKLYRACEINTPAPRGHFLRTFGQSDRLSISNANRDASVPQSLAIYNGELTEGVMNPYSSLLRRVRSIPAKPDRIDALFLGILTRYPTEKEAAIAKNESLENLIAALLATSECLFLRQSIFETSTHLPSRQTRRVLRRQCRLRETSPVDSLQWYRTP